ncbi:DNA replication licensing factor Mcm6 [Gryllus bimaculatus]|nr:DNA replication licensing factor Mcm6 [Gryllus bimaculatus]
MEQQTISYAKVVDYAIARKIVELHSNIQESVDSVYSREDVLKYITFARQFKPYINEDAAELLVKQYTHLRQRDCSGNSKSTWRITVRQLESMIRLSESMAKMECSDEVLPKHVTEAYRLLNKSIIRVEQPDIHLEEGADEPMAVDEAEKEQRETPQEGDETVAKKKLTLPFEEYKSLSNMLVTHIRNKEIEAESTRSGVEGMRRSEVIHWYLEKIQEVLESEEELLERKGLVEKVIDRLIYHDQVIIPLISTGLKGDEESSEEDPMLVVHPNYVIDS